MRFRLFKIFILNLVAWVWAHNGYAQQEFSTRYFKIRIDHKGWITSMKNATVSPQREFSPVDKPSPLMSIYDSEKQRYYQPTKGTYHKTKQTFTLHYSNGSVATISLIAHEKYIKLKLLSLHPRNGIDAIQCGAYHTNITNLFGEIIGVARDTSEAVNYAIGMLALNDNTLGGVSETIADAAPFEYMVHSPDKQRFPLPSHLHEGQIFSIGGDGISDVAFYAHKEPYYRILYGNAAQIDAKGRISIAYNSRDRAPRREVYFSLIPHMPVNKPNHLEVQPLAGVDYIGSSVALWGSPDSTALLDVIQNVVLSEGLPYPTIDGKWVKDPAAFVPDALTSGNLYDSIVKAEALGVPYIRFTGSTLSEGSWHYQSIWNVGGGKNMYDLETREWGSATSQGKDLRDVTYANFFPVSMGANFPIQASSTVVQYEHIQAISVGVGGTYSLQLNQRDVESCPEKFQIFRAIRTWENARVANAFPGWVKKELANPANQFHLVETSVDTWKLYKIDLDGKNPRLFGTLNRDIN